MRRSIASTLCLASLLLMGTPSHAQRPLARAAGAVRSFFSYNARADRDEKLSVLEFRRFHSGGALPSRVQPQKVLDLKIRRAELALARLRMAGKPGSGAGLIIDEMASGGLARLSDVSRLVAEARQYAESRGLGENRTPALAKEALDLAGPQLSGQSSFAGLGQHAVAVEIARQSARDLAHIAGR
jgi:hypothetical protein